MGCFTRFCIAWNARVGSNRGGARLRTDANANIIRSKRRERKPWRSNEINGSLFRPFSASYGTDAMFDLELAIANWKRQLIATGIKWPQVLAELECHLSEDIQHLTRS